MTGDSRVIDIVGSLKKENKQFANLLEGKKFNGIFSSPPYVGLIDYHEQNRMLMVCLDSIEIDIWKSAIRREMEKRRENLMQKTLRCMKL